MTSDLISTQQAADRLGLTTSALHELRCRDDGLSIVQKGFSVGYRLEDNHRINRLSTIQEHYMIRRAIDRGVSKERLARAFNVNLSSINRRINLLSGICPEAIALLQDHQFTPDVTRILRNMKAARQVAVSMRMDTGLLRMLSKIMERLSASVF